MGNGSGAAGYLTVRPDVTYFDGDWSEVGAATTYHGAVNDNSDATYVEDAGTSSSTLKFGFGVASSVIGATERAKAVRLRVRYRSNSGISGSLVAILYRDSSVGSGYASNFPTTATAITDAAGAWFTTTAQGNEWGSYVDSFTTLLYPSATGLGAAWRLYELYADVDIRELLTLGTPVVTNTSQQRPTITWTPTLNADGDAQKKYEVFVYPQSSYTAAGFSPGVPVGSGGKPWSWTSGQVAGPAGSVQAGIDLDFGVTYRVYMRIAQDFNGADWWTGYGNDAGFTLTIPGGATSQPLAPTVTRTIDNPNARVVLDISTGFNQLTANQSSLETDTTGWAAGTTTTIARATAAAAHLTASLQITKNTSGGTASATTPTGTSGVAVQPSTTYTALASFRAAVTARTCTVKVKFYTAAGSYLSSSDLTSTGTADNNSGFTQASVTGSSPATAAFAAVEVSIASAALSEVHYVDKVSLHLGSSTTWGLGGYLTLSTSGVVVEYQEVLGPNLLPANVADAGDTAGNTTGWEKRTVADLLDLYGGSGALLGTHSIRWGPSAAGSILDAGMLATSPTYDTAPLVAPSKTMIASAWVRAETGTFQTTLTVGAHNNSGSTAAAAGTATTVGTTWTRITSGALAASDSSLYGYVSFANTGATTTGRLLIDKVQLEVGSEATDWVQGTGNRPSGWTGLRASPIAATTLPNNQQVWLHDYEVPRGRGIRIYRIRTEVVEGASQLTSTNVYSAAWQTPAESVWWLKDPLAPGLNWAATWVLDTVSEQIAEDVDTVHPLGRPHPVSVSSWISSGADGTLQFHVSGEAHWRALERLLRRQTALLLQSPAGMNKYIRFTDRNWERRGHRDNLQRVVQVTYIEEGAP